MTTLSNPRSTLRPWRNLFLTIEIVLLIVLLLAGLNSASWEARALLLDIYMVLGFALLLAWVGVLIGHRSQLTSLRAASTPCWLPFAFVLIWMLVTLFSD